jgi:signal transduction histidine kinase
MLVNLVSNAKKFTPTEGEVAVSTHVDETGAVVIKVKDTGIGMSADDIPKALAMFSQLDNGHARQHEGTGLGLPIVKSLMQLHGGVLKLESELGRGTTATLCFPPSRTRSRLKDASAA